MKIAKIQIGFYNLFNNLTKYLKTIELCNYLNNFTSKLLFKYYV